MKMLFVRYRTKGKLMHVGNHEQGTSEWWAAKLGVPGSSDFSKILTPAKLEVSSSSRAYSDKLLGERMSGKTDDGFKSDWMKRGTELEPEAADYYAFINNVKLERVGFCLHDSGLFGCSPDRLINRKAGLEIKCLSPGVHARCLLNNKLPTAHRLQVIGSLLASEYEYWDFLSYNPDMVSLMIRTYPADFTEEMKKLDTGLRVFCKKLDNDHEKLKQMMEENNGNFI